MENILITIISVVPTWYFAIKKPSYSIAAILLFLPTFLIRWSLGPLHFNTLDLLIIGAFIIWFIKNYRELNQYLLQHRATTLLFLLWIFAATLALFFTQDIIAALGVWKSYFFLPVLLAFMLLATIKTKHDIKVIGIALTLLSIGISSAAIIQRFYPLGINGFLAIPNPVWQMPETLRVTSFLQYPNAVGLILAPIIPLLTGLFYVTKNNFIKILTWLAIIGGFTSIWLAKSKGALLALVIIGIAALIYQYRKIAIAVFLIIATLVIIFTPSFNFIATYLGPNSYSAQLRFSQWQESWEMLKDSPLAGAGLAGFQEAVAPYHTRDYLEIFLYPHNIFLNFWSELGLTGLILFIVLVWYSVKQSFYIIKVSERESKERILTVLGLFALGVLLLHGMVDVPYFKNDLAVLFWLIWSWPIIIKQVFIKKDIEYLV